MGDLKRSLRKPKPVPVVLAETGETVYLRYWTFGERDRFLLGLEGWHGDQTEAAGESVLCDMLRNSLTDEHGDPLYTPEDDKEIMSIPAVPMMATVRAALRLNDINRENHEAAKKN